jgi:hypothetical protein
MNNLSIVIVVLSLAGCAHRESTQQVQSGNSNPSNQQFQQAEFEAASLQVMTDPNASHRVMRRFDGHPYCHEWFNNYNGGSVLARRCEDGFRCTYVRSADGTWMTDCPDWSGE